MKTKTLGINEDACSWVARNLNRELSDVERKLVTVVCATLRRGPYDVPGFLKMKSEGWGSGAMVSVFVGDMATFDLDFATRFVFACHDLCVRGSISPHGPQRLALTVFSREREGDISKRHPTMEQALADWRYRL